MEARLATERGSAIVEVTEDKTVVRKYTKEELERYIGELDQSIGKFEERRAYFQSLLDLYGTKG